MPFGCLYVQQGSMLSLIESSMGLRSCKNPYNGLFKYFMEFYHSQRIATIKNQRSENHNTYYISDTSCLFKSDPQIERNAKGKVQFNTGAVK